MKKMILLIAAASTLSGCAASDKDLTPDPALLASASTVEEMLPYMTASEDQRLYSEAEKNSTLERYFDVIDYNKDEYLVLESGGEKYALFYYRVYSSVRSIIGIDAVEKTYGGKDGGDLTINATASYFYNEGYHESITPPLSFVRCIVKLDRDIDRLIVEDSVYEPFAFGRLIISGKTAIVNEDLTLAAPFRFDRIEWISEAANDSRLREEGKTYYICYEGDKCGVMNERYEVLIEPAYSRLDYIGYKLFRACDSLDPNDPEARQYELGVQ